MAVMECPKCKMWHTPLYGEETKRARGYNFDIVRMRYDFYCDECGTTWTNETVERSDKVKTYGQNSPSRFET